MSIEGKLVLAALLLVAGAISFFFGDRELPVRTGIVTKVVFPAFGRGYKGKLIGAGLWFVAGSLLWGVRHTWL